MTLAQAERLSRLSVTSPTQGWSAEVFVSDAAGLPTGLSGWGSPVTHHDGIDGSVTFDLHGRTGRHVLVWITDLGRRPAAGAHRDRRAPAAELSDDGARHPTTGCSSVGRHQGHEPSLNQLLVQHYDRVYAICRRMTGNDTDALDAAQDTLIAIVWGLDRFDGRSSFATWAYRVTTNACLDQLRRDAAPTVAQLDHEAPTRAARPTSTRPWPTGSPSTTPSPGSPPSSERRSSSATSIGLDYAEIAEVLDIPPGTVRSGSPGRRALAGHLRDTPPRRPPGSDGISAAESGNPPASPNVGAGTP